MSKCPQRVLGQLGGQMSPKTVWGRRRKTLKRRGRGRGSILTLKRDCQGFDSCQLGALNQCVLWQAAGRILYTYSFDNCKTLPFNFPNSNCYNILIARRGFFYLEVATNPLFVHSKTLWQRTNNQAHVSSSICLLLSFSNFFKLNLFCF